MEECLISVIMPIFNSEKYLARSIESILKQSYRKLELILINDGSTDSSLSIINSYKKRDSRIMVINNERNIGASKSREKGLKKAKGEIVSFVDSDDWLDGNIYQKSISNLLDTNADIVAFGECVVSPSGEEKELIGKSEVLCSGHDALYKLSINDLPFQWGLCNKIYKRDVISSVSFSNLVFCEDLLLIPSIFNKANKVSYIPEALYYVYKGQGSVTRNKMTIKQLKDEEIAWSEVIKYYELNCPKGYANIIYRRFTGLRWRFTDAYLSRKNGDCENEIYRYIKWQIQTFRAKIYLGEYRVRRRVLISAFYLFPSVLANLSKINMIIHKVERWK